NSKPVEAQKDSNSLEKTIMYLNNSPGSRETQQNHNILEKSALIYFNFLEPKKLKRAKTYTRTKSINFEKYVEFTCTARPAISRLLITIAIPFNAQMKVEDLYSNVAKSFRRKIEKTYIKQCDENSIWFDQ
ncbi:unnamed protein product, partial [Trichogramma brassicae]